MVKSAKKRPKVITCANHKGGCAKTATTVILSQVLAHEGWRILVIDTDPQGNASEILLPSGMPITDYVTLETCLADTAKTPLCLAEGWMQQISVLPCCTRLEEPFPSYKLQPNENLLPFAVEDVPLSYRVRLNALRDIMRNVPNIESYDYVIIDTAPSLSPLTQSAIAAADAIVMPCTLVKHSVDGVPKMIELVRNVWKSVGDPPVPVIVIGTIHDARFREEFVWKQSLIAICEDDRYIEMIPYVDRKVVGIVPRIARLSSNLALHRSILYKLDEKERQSLLQPVRNILKVVESGTFEGINLAEVSIKAPPRRRTAVK